jgi:thiamine-phosphate pyrophosphorylase
VAKADGSTAPRCQLYLSAPARLASEAPLIEAALRASGAPSLLMIGEGDPEAMAALIARMHRENAIVLTDTAQMLTSTQGFDGLHLGRGGLAVKAARELVGPDGVVGADCPLSRHEAMSLTEAGADYVAFGRSGEHPDGIAAMVRWWSDIIEIPCAVWLPADAAEEDWRKLGAAGADFIVPEPEIWDDTGAVRDRLARIAAHCRAEGD